MDAELDERIKKVADWCLSNGISVIPIDRNSKKPAIAWGKYIDERLPAWSFENCNVGLITGETNGVVVVDFDDDSYTWWMKNRPRTPAMVKTKRGMHFYYQWNGTYTKSDSHIQVADGVEHDLKGDRAFVVFPCSYSGGHQYNFVINDDNPRGTWIDPKKLPLFQPEWRPERPVKDWAEGSKIKDMRAYMAKVFAREGQGGDKTTWRLCCILQENGIPEADAVALLCEWNQTNALPSWTVDEIRRKVATAFNG